MRVGFDDEPNHALQRFEQAGRSMNLREAKNIFPLAASAFMLMVSTVGFAETRGRHFTPEQLHKQSTLVIKGDVREIETVAEFKVSFPIRASVDAVVKGRWKEKEIAFQHKHPGLNVIFEQEYNKPAL